MKKFLFFLALVCAACTKLFPSAGSAGLASMTVKLSNPLGELASKAGETVPFVEDFIFELISSDGAVLYKGRYADSPDVFNLQPGSYTVSARSSEFREAAYSSPVYGDERIVNLKSGESISVELVCAQTNSGVRLVPDASFRSEFPHASIYLNGEGGSLMFSYGEKRTAYFLPGNFTVSLVDGASERRILTRSLEPRNVLILNLSASRSVSGDGAVSVVADTSRNWVSDSFTYGSEGSRSTALSVTEALSRVGEKDVWVYGYIAGSFSTSTKLETSAPFSKNTNVVISSRTSVSDKESCICVELSSGGLRNALNLMDNPSLLGRRVFLKGSLVESYYSITGLKSVKEYSLD